MLRPLSLLPVLLLLAAAAAAACEEEEVLPEEVGQAQETTATAGPTPEATATSSPQPTAEPTAAPTPTPSPALTPESPSVDTSGWLTYEDPEFGFSLRYPPEMTFEDETPPASSEFRRVLFFRSQSDPRRGFAVSIVDNPRGLTVEQWAREYTACHFDPPYEIRSVEVDGEGGITCVAEAIEGKFSLEAVIGRGDQIVFLGVVLPESEFQALLSELRFTPR